MAKPRWSELAAAFGLDTISGEPGARPESATDDLSRWLETDDPEPAGDGDGDRADAAGSDDAGAGEGDDLDDSLERSDGELQDDEEPTTGGEPGVQEADEHDGESDRPAGSTADEVDPDAVSDELVVLPAEGFGELLLAEGVDVQGVAAPKEVGTMPNDEADRFAELGTHVAHAMRVAYDAVGEMKRLEQRIAAILATHDAVRATLVEAAEELHRSLAEMTPGE